MAVDNEKVDFAPPPRMIKDIRLSVYAMNDSGYACLWFYVTPSIKNVLGFSHTGYAYSVVCLDELFALIDLGFKPFSKADMDIDVEERENAYQGFSRCDTRPKMRFIIRRAEFTGGIGEWASLSNKDDGHKLLLFDDGCSPKNGPISVNECFEDIGVDCSPHDYDDYYGDDWNDYDIGMGMDD